MTLDLGDDAPPPVLRAKRDNPEDRLQMAIWSYAQAVLPSYADFASVETKLGYDNERGGGDRKKRGIRAGETDCRTIFMGVTRYHELKWKTGLSDAQRARHAQLRAAGAIVDDDVRTVQQMRAIWEHMGITLRFHAFTALHRDQALRARAAAPAKP